MMATVLLAWKINPTGSLAAFLCITAFHYGTGDTLTTFRTPTGIRVADLIGRGGTVLTFKEFSNTRTRCYQIEDKIINIHRKSITELFLLFLDVTD